MLVLADLSRRAEMLRAVSEIREKFDAIDVLVNNAGVLLPERRLTEDGVENTASSIRVPAQADSSQGWTATFDLTIEDAGLDELGEVVTDHRLGLAEDLGEVATPGRVALLTRRAVRRLGDAVQSTREMPLQ